MAEHTSLPWKVFTTTDGRKLVGIGAQSGEGILDCGFGVWAWDDAAGIANANLVVKAVNNHYALVSALKLQEAAEQAHLSCEQCEGEEIPELCSTCFPLYDDARIARRSILAVVGPVGSSGK